MELAATHFGLSIDPPIVPPGGTLALRYRAVNHGAVPAPPATVRFLIDPDAVDALPDDVALGVLAPGEAVDVSATVRLSSLARNGDDVRVQAALTVGDADPLGSNVAVAHVRGRAVLAAAPSRIVLRPAGPAGWTLEITIANTGDAPSGPTRLSVELPPGLCAAGAATRLDRPVPPLEPGAATTIAVALTVEGVPALPIQILDAALSDPDGRRVALPPSEPVWPPLEPPVLALTLERAGRRVDATITIANSNSGPLTDLVLEATWPRTFRPADGSFAVDGRTPLRSNARAAAATLKTSAGGASLAVSRVAPRATTTIAFSGFAGTGGGEVALLLRAGERDYTARAMVPLGAPCDPELALATGIPPCVAGDEATVDALLIGGDEACLITLHADDSALRVFVDGAPTAPGAAFTLAAGTRRDVRIVVPVDAACADGTRIEHLLRATSDRGHATDLTIAFTVRSRAWLDVADWLVPVDGGARVAIVNAGSTPATGVRLEAADGTNLTFDTIAPGETAARTLDADVTAAFAAGATLHRTGAEPLAIAPLRRPSAATAAIAFDLPADVHEGIAFDVRWTLTLSAAAQTLALRCAEHSGLTVVAGSTSIDGHAIVDGATARLAGGITLHDVPAHTPVVFAARCIAREPGDVAVAIATTIDGGDEQTISAHVRAEARTAFPQKPATLRFYLDAPALDAAPAAPAPHVVEPPQIDEPAPLLDMIGERAATLPDLDDRRRALLMRALQRSGDDPIADALGVLAALMPAGAARDAFIENAERLSVKLRIPGYRAEPDDYESASAREALDRARGEAGVGPLAAPRGSVAALAVWCATIDAGVAPALPVAAFVRAFVQFADEGRGADRHALAAARDDMRAALAAVA